MAREHGPKCIKVAAELLDDPDPRIRLAALAALLDRGFGRPAQTIAATSDIPTLQFQHLVAVKSLTPPLVLEHAIELRDSAQATIDQLAAEGIPTNGAARPQEAQPLIIDLATPALE